MSETRMREIAGAEFYAAYDPNCPGCQAQTGAGPCWNHDPRNRTAAAVAPAEREERDALTEHDANCLEWAATVELERTVGKAEVREANAATFLTIAQKIRTAIADAPAKPRTLYWHTDPSYPCPTCGHVANPRPEGAR